MTSFKRPFHGPGLRFVFVCLVSTALSAFTSAVVAADPQTAEAARTVTQDLVHRVAVRFASSDANAEKLLKHLQDEQSKAAGVPAPQSLTATREFLAFLAQRKILAESEAKYLAGQLETEQAVVATGAQTTGPARTVTQDLVHQVAVRFVSSDANAEKLLKHMQDEQSKAAGVATPQSLTVTREFLAFLVQRKMLAQDEAQHLAGQLEAEPTAVAQQAAPTAAQPEPAVKPVRRAARKSTAEPADVEAVAKPQPPPPVSTPEASQPEPAMTQATPVASADASTPTAQATEPEGPSTEKSTVAADAIKSTDAPKETVTEELIRLLADRYALSKDDADKLIQRLKDEKAQTAQKAPPTATDQPPLADAAATAGAQPNAENKGRVRVIYLPESEKKRIREEVKQEVIETAKTENWAKPYALPDWVKRLKIDGDLRLRQEFDYFDSKNSSQFINFQAINSGPPLNITPPASGQPLTIPTLDSTKNRQQPRIRVRLGILSNVSDDMTAGLRFTTGNNTNPVSTNQTLGTDFNKASFVIDRAYLNYRPTPTTSYWGGRIPNPWLSTELVWDDDLAFDGVAGQFDYEWKSSLTQHSTVGLFSVENTDFNFPSTSLAKVHSRDKWLLGFQTGADWQIQEDKTIKTALALYDFYHLEGKVSSPCFAPNTSVSCDTDDSRPAFIQKGNTLIALRDLVVTNPATDPRFQYFGLASPFRILDLTGSLDWVLKGPIHLIFDADFAFNTAFHKSDVEKLTPVNNFGSCPSSSPSCTAPYEGGPFAFLMQWRYGYPKINEKGEWNAVAGYRRVESDAVVDAFNDSDFHLGGTNAKGYYLGGNYGFTHNGWLGARWLSSTEVSGAPYAIDVLQIDLNARF